jgi:hypothetical protein
MWLTPTACIGFAFARKGRALQRKQSASRRVARTAVFDLGEEHVVVHVIDL